MNKLFGWPTSRDLLPLVLTIGLSLVLSGCGSVRSAEFVGKEAPYARITMFDGSMKLLQQYRGKTLVLVFWATTCQHSNPVVEAADQLAKQYRGKKVEFLAVNLDTAAQYDTVALRVRGEKLRNLSHAHSGNEGLDELFMSFKGDSLPLVVVVDERGTVVDMSRSIDGAERFLARL